MGFINGVPIANITGAEIIMESSQQMYIITTIKSMTPEPVYSEGKEDELRSKNRILAQNFLDDILKGYNIKLKDILFSAEIMEAIQGGENDYDDTLNVAVYRAPLAGVDQTKPRFILRVYSEEKDADGTSRACYRFSFPGCVGTDAHFSLEDGEFLLPEYTIRSRAPFAASCMEIECFDGAPEYLHNAGELPALPAIGKQYIAMVPMTVQGVELTAGEGVMRTSGGYEKVELIGAVK